MNRIFVRLLTCVALLAASISHAAPADRGPIMLAAASMQEAMTAAADIWTARGHPRPILSFAGSSALARQIKAGAPADLFLSADEEWMDDVARAGWIAPDSRATLAGNVLVLVAPRNRPVRLRIGRNMPIARALGDGRLAMADPDSVPAGKYGKAALTSLGVWPQVMGKVVRADNVRSALTLVERGEVPLGIVYATDARASRGVVVVGAFPAGSHAPIRYPIARIKSSAGKDAEGFRRFLLSPAGKAILARYGFSKG
ncbi:molybdate ABC transporter substrate-binding protein [Sphingobium sp. CAP-1]|uniref:molybdate ABC transporter substrate-binding protein n=1 Tax=Sphingobium sp. CAP-1 TaxID=2676077 RepID=UPI0012BB2C09|nr:molybdate ABC transporter substrate-binding protein [Sphingobium sp. CAP-1]QGP77603.1 molybdate ABC transporter substrate-binding protein [Sphingobium sp. CAP-1]